MDPVQTSASTRDAGMAVHASRLTRVYDVGSVQVTGVDGIDLSIAGEVPSEFIEHWKGIRNLDH